MELSQEDYKVAFDESQREVMCQGSLMLSGTEEYAPILELLKTASVQAVDKLTLDIQKLEFINSSGINTLTKFVITARNQAGLVLTVRYSEEQPWQIKLVSNLNRLMPAMQLEKI